MSLIAQSPQSIGQILDAGFRIFRASVVALLPLTLASSLINTLPSLAPTGAPGAMNAMAYAWLALATFVSMPLYAAVIKRLDDIASQRNQVTMGESLKVGLRCFFPLWLASICYFLTIMVGMLLLVVPGIYFVISMAFFSYVLVLEGGGITESLSRSRALVKGHWWRTSVILTVAGIIYMAVYMAAMAIVALAFPMGQMVSAATGQADSVLVLLATFGLNTVVGALLTPLMYSVTLATYRDLQLRKSGADLAARLDATA